MVYCSQCGAENPDSDRFCGQCGTQLFIPNAQQLHPQVPPPGPSPTLQYPPKSTLTPVSDLLGGLLRSGAVGSFYVAGVATLIGITSVITFYDPPEGMDFTNVLLYFLIIISMLLLLVTVLTKSIGYIGFLMNYGSHFSVVPFIFGLVAPVILVVLGFFGMYSQGLNGFYHIETKVWAGHIMVGIMLIFMGISFFLVGKRSGLKGNCILSGIFQIIAGGMLIGYLGHYGIAWFVLTGAEISAGITFLKMYSTSPSTLNTHGRQLVPHKLQGGYNGR